MTCYARGKDKDILIGHLFEVNEVYIMYIFGVHTWVLCLNLYAYYNPILAFIAFCNQYVIWTIAKHTRYVK